MTILRNQELQNCSNGGECSFAGVSQGIAIIFVTVPLVIASGILMLIYLRRVRKNPQTIEKVNILVVAVWTILLSLFASVIVPVLI